MQIVAPWDTANYTVALRQASNKLPVITEFINRRSPPRLGHIEVPQEVLTHDVTVHTPRTVEVPTAPSS